MKRILLLLAFLPLAFSCRKSISPQTESSVSILLHYLKDSLSATDYADLDTTAILRSNTPDGITTWRVPLHNPPGSAHFLLVRTGPGGDLLQGRLFHFTRSTPAGSPTYTGAVDVYSLGHQVLLRSGITEGYIDALHPVQIGNVTIDNMNGATSMPASAGAEVLPEVVVVGYIATPVSDFTAFVSVDDLLGSLGPGASANGTGAANGQGSPGTSVGGGGVGGGVSSGVIYIELNPGDPGNENQPAGPGSIPSILVDQDYTASLPVVDLSKMFNCFDDDNIVPSIGATYTITICSDVPVNALPEAAINNDPTSAGHSFLVVTKTNGTASLTQAFGFYPAQTPSVFNPFAPVPSNVKDNGGHEVNASYSINVSHDQFAGFRQTALNLSKNQYSLDNDNCTDFAVGSFNAAGGTQLNLPPLIVYMPATIMNGVTASPSYQVKIKNSPQGLYAALQQMKQQGGAQAANIHLDLSGKTQSPKSHGQCD
ncbi:hypothetical protein [Dinghuibacter silviterrae]|uniref:Uncharacterized protein n=1 Tax=Dinghuibacter silviterrae TaxID=1539049 RepID=A0A4R8DH89_9BACT|nr:hypothetical protein [Dinghuibacter silviterrae]TDW97073.1 hypothetical protein EDB95_4913 [Dinghuibacter silviterrae]